MQNYWGRKTELAFKATTHTAEMNSLFENEICRSAKSTMEIDLSRNEYAIGTRKNLNVNQPRVKMEVLCMTTTDAIFRTSAEDKICVLNFASFKNPGGEFLNGSSAQEESLCHESTLYNILRQKSEWYSENMMRLNRGLYADRGMLVPNVRFIRNSISRFCSVVIASAPNNGVAIRNGVPKISVSAALKSRIDMVLNTIELGQECVGEYDVIILGAFGCGVFKNDPSEVASLFYDGIHTRCFKHVVFAITDMRMVDIFNSGMHNKSMRQ